MSDSALNKERFEAIEAYLLGAMPSTERLRFEQEIASDAGLRAEVELQRENMLAVELGGFQRVLKQVSSEQEEQFQRSGRGWTYYLRYAAVIALLMAGSLWWFSRPSANQRLFAANFEMDPGLPVAMGAAEDHDFHDAMVAYKLGDYAEARAKWSSQLRADPANDTLRFYIAGAAMGVDDMEGAIPLLSALRDDHRSVFNARAKWYLLLSYLRIGELDKAMAVSLEDDPVYGERVRAIKEELRSR